MFTCHWGFVEVKRSQPLVDLLGLPPSLDARREVDECDEETHEWDDEEEKEGEWSLLTRNAAVSA